MERTCDGCTKCCEGWLNTTVKGQPIFPGKPCHYVSPGKGCSVYKTRPKEPCRTFKCSWLQDPTIPEWMAPKDSGVIILHNTIDGNRFVELVTTGESVPEHVLSWFILWGLSTTGNIRWMNKHGVSYWHGTPEFANAMNAT